MTKPKILITGEISPFVAAILREQLDNGEIEIIIDRLEVDNLEIDTSDYNMIAEGGNCLPVLSEDQISDLRDRIKEGNLNMCPDLICDSITLAEGKPYQNWTPYKTKTIAKHNYLWYYQRSFR